MPHSLTTRAVAFACLSSWLMTASAAGERVETPLEYVDDGTTFRGQLVYDDAVRPEQDVLGDRLDLTHLPPGVVVVHEWWGLTEHPLAVSRRLADAGYVVLAADLYGDGLTVDTPPEAMREAGRAREAGLADRATLAVRTLIETGRVDPGRVAVIGFCFGGTTALEVARAQPDENAPVAAVVSFHGDLKPVGQPIGEGEGEDRPAVLVLHGGADPLVPPQDVGAFVTEMLSAGVRYTLVNYPTAKHSFTNPRADEFAREFDMTGAVAYDEAVAEDAFARMKAFLDAEFATTDARPARDATYTTTRPANGDR